MRKTIIISRSVSSGGTAGGEVLPVANMRISVMTPPRLGTASEGSDGGNVRAQRQAQCVVLTVDQRKGGAAAGQAQGGQGRPSWPTRALRRGKRPRRTYLRTRLRDVGRGNCSARESTTSVTGRIDAQLIA